MKKTSSILLAFGIAASTLSFAQGRGTHGKPSMTGIGRAQSVANQHGDKGLNNAEAKQSKHKKHHSKKHKPVKSRNGSAD